MKPPQMKFLSHVWHPNISSQTGAICVDILKDEWSPAITLTKTLQSLQALLCAPEPTDPQDAVVAKQYMEDNDSWATKAKEWTKMYAGPLDEKVGTLEGMGFSKEKAAAAIVIAGGNLEQAATALLSGD